MKGWQERSDSNPVGMEFQILGPLRVLIGDRAVPLGAPKERALLACLIIHANEVVSTDFIGNRHAGIVDSHATIVQGRQVILYVWYDNEFGYSCQVVRVGQKMAGIRYPNVPTQPVTDSQSAAAVAKLKTA